MRCIAVGNAIAAVWTQLARGSALAIAVSRGRITIRRSRVALLAIFELHFLIPTTGGQHAAWSTSVGIGAGIAIFIRAVVALLVGGLHGPVTATRAQFAARRALTVAIRL